MNVRFTTLDSFIEELQATQREILDVVRACVDVQSIGEGSDKRFTVHFGFMVCDELMEYSEVVGEEWEGGPQDCMKLAEVLIDHVRSLCGDVPLRGGRFN